MDVDQPVIWRGPMVMKAVEQFLQDVAWGALDFLVIDLPPGTGDAQLTLTQKIQLSGAVIVTTPQDVSLIDARKGLAMFQKVNVPVLGIVENMSYYVCPKCGHREEIFKHGGGRRTAEQLGVPFLGEIPLDPKVTIGGDAGQPIVAGEPKSAVTEAYLSHRRRHRPAPLERLTRRDAMAATIELAKTDITALRGRRDRQRRQRGAAARLGRRRRDPPARRARRSRRSATASARAPWARPS